MIASSAVARPVVCGREPGSGRGITGLALGRKGLRRLQRADRDGLSKVFPPQQKFLLVGQRPAPALIADDLFEKRVAAIPSEGFFRAFLVHGVAQLVEMG